MACSAHLDTAHGPSRASVASCAALGLVNTETSPPPSNGAAWRAFGRARRLGRTKRAVIGAAAIIEAACPSDRFYRVMITPTYAPGISWQPYHVTYLVERMRKYLARRGVLLRFVWVMELTKAGNPHYHLVVWLPKGVMLPKPDQAGWWPHGSTRIEAARRPIAYLAKYVSKGTDTERIPHGARIRGAGGLESAGRIMLRWKLLPRYVRLDTEPGEHCIKPRGLGGWVSTVTGQFWPSPVARVVDGVVIFEGQRAS